MSFTVDYSTDVGVVRGIIGDVDATRPFLEDEQIQSNITQFVALELASAACLEAMAVRAVMTVGKLKILDLDLDGTALASVLRAMAKDMREVYYNNDIPDFDIATQLLTPANLRAFYYNEFLQGREVDGSIGGFDLV